VIRIHRVSGFISSFEILFERFLLPIPMKPVPPMSALYFILLFWTALSCIIYLLLFCLSSDDLFILI
jgi:hypothetical protein